MEDGDSKLKITVAKNGPLLLEGQVEIFNADGTSSCTGSKGDLCRCGGSSNKPFCDNTHKRIGFEAA
ncbi:MAG: CDGSH iron-sulfur domain-containing protein [Anaerolineae bacterium]|nr:CDGSH iron-sulfur domain-containing protein [Anaerolineae bacterium]